MADESKYTREEIEALIRQCCDDAAMQAVALFTDHIKQWIRSLFRRVAVQLLSWLWKPALLGMIGLALWLFWKLHDYL